MTTVKGRCQIFFLVHLDTDKEVLSVRDAITLITKDARTLQWGVDGIPDVIHVCKHVDTRAGLFHLSHTQEHGGDRSPRRGRRHFLLHLQITMVTVWQCVTKQTKIL